MSTFGSPGKLPLSKPTPPQRGSFPLDHDGECKTIVANYLACIKKARGVNEHECRDLAKSYLSCRMDSLADLLRRNLMARDEFKNLGFADATFKTLETGREPVQDEKPVQDKPVQSVKEERLPNHTEK